MPNNHNCAQCGGCSGNCTDCSGCSHHGGELVLTPAEIEILQLLGQVAFLPIARKMGDPDPVYLEDPGRSPEESSLLLQTLEKKNLISLDYDKPLRGVYADAYAAYPIHGSMALTRRGQQVLELLEYQGISDDI